MSSTMEMDKMLETKFSFSKINTYKNCPQKYKINYINKIRKKHEGIEAFMGKRVHEVLEWFYYERKEQSLSFYPFDILLEKYNHLWEDNWHDNIYIARQNYTIVRKKNKKFRKYFSLEKNKEMLKHIGEICLANYYKRYMKGFDENIDSVELKLSVEINNLKFNCIIDRLDIDNNGNYKIYDYKTGKKSISYSAAMNDLQLSLYQLAIKENYKDCKTISLNWYYLREDKITTVEHSEQKLSQLKNKILYLIEKIKNDKDFVAKKSILCDWCYFWEECEVMVTSNPAKKLI